MSMKSIKNTSFSLLTFLLMILTMSSCLYANLREYREHGELDYRTVYPLGESDWMPLRAWNPCTYGWPWVVYDESNDCCDEPPPWNIQNVFANAVLCFGMVLVVGVSTEKLIRRRRR
jgi:hypothetical protein